MPDDGSTWAMPLAARTAAGGMAALGSQGAGFSSPSGPIAVDLRRWARLRRLARGAGSATALGFLRDAGLVLTATIVLRGSDWLGGALPLPPLQSLGVRAGHSPVSVRTALETAQMLNLLEKIADPGDGRRVKWEPTATAKGILLSLAAEWRQAISEACPRLNLTSDAAPPLEDVRLCGLLLAWLGETIEELGARDRHYLVRSFALLLLDLAMAGPGTVVRDFIIRAAADLGVSQQTIRLKLEQAQALGLVEWRGSLGLTVAGEAWVQTMLQVAGACAARLATVG